MLKTKVNTLIKTNHRYPIELIPLHIPISGDIESKHVLFADNHATDSGNGPSISENQCLVTSIQASIPGNQSLKIGNYLSKIGIQRSITANCRAKTISSNLQSAVFQ
nr:hypothetical protein [uncultured Draconibacterium sp.]